jgi:hypothetical protein
VFTSTKTILCSLFLFLLSFEVDSCSHEHNCSTSFRSLCRVVILINLLALSDKNVMSRVEWSVVKPVLWCLLHDLLGAGAEQERMGGGARSSTVL